MGRIGNRPTLLRLKLHLRRHQLGMLIPKVPVRSHSERSPILVTEPSGNGRDIDATLDAPGGEQMPQIVVGNPMRADLLASLCKGFLALGH